MKIAVIADSHFDESSRFEECRRLHDWIWTDLAERGVDLVLHSGDVFERKSTPTERTAVAGWLARMANLAPVVVVRGNHDAVGDLAIFARLRTAHPVIVEEACGVHRVAGAAVACLAWPRKAELLARLQAEGGPVGHEESEQIAGDALRSVLRGMGAELAAHDGPRLLLSHAMVRGSITSTGQPLVGCDLEVGLDDLALACADFVALGHIHKGQDWALPSGAPVVYPGSPRRTAFGEIEDKEYIVATIEGHAASWERIIVPATPMLLLSAAWDGAELDASPPADLRGAEVRLRYEVTTDQRDAARRAAGELRTAMLAEGAASVKVEEAVVATVRARCPEVAAAKTLAEKVQAYWRARAQIPDGTRAWELLGKLGRLEESART